MNIKKRLEAVGHVSIKGFVEYCDTNSQTPKALFQKEEVALMARLAGSPKNWNRPQEIEKSHIKVQSLHEEMGELIGRYKFINGQLEKAKTIKDVVQVAKTILYTAHGPLSMVAGPKSKGGKISEELNILAIQNYMEELYEAGENIFNDTIFEESLQRIKDEGEVYNMLNDFYLPLFESGYIKKMFFMKDWRFSTGATLQQQALIRLGGIKRIYQTDLIQA